MMEKQGGKRGLGFSSLPGGTEHEAIKGVLSFRVARKVLALVVCWV